jgi:DNA polymerase-1
MSRYDTVILDGNNMFFKAFSVHGSLSVRNEEGELFTGATFGLIQSIIAAKRDYLKEDGKMFIVWDKGHTRRTEIYPEYKANRNKDEWADYENFKTQMKMAKYVLSFLGINQAIKDGEEADDLAGTISKQNSDAGKSVLLISADKDFQQLIKGNIHLLAHKGAGNIRLWNEDTWEKDRGYNPSQFSLFLALNGDKGDNIPGINGIGEVAANKFIIENSSLLYAILDKRDINPFIPAKETAAIKKLISNEGQENFRLSFELALIDNFVKNIKIKRNKNLEKLQDIFEQLQFDSLLPGGKHWDIIVNM